MDPWEERRVDPMLDKRAVTFAEMWQGHQQQGLSYAQLEEHWHNLKAALALRARGSGPPNLPQIWPQRGYLNRP